MLNNIFKNKEINDFVRISLLLILFGYITFHVWGSLGGFTEEIYCGAESTAGIGINEHFEANGYSFDNAYGRSEEKALTGRYSVKLTPENQYGMSIKLGIPKPNEEYEGSVWCYIQNNVIDTIGFECLVVASGNQFWKGATEFVEKRNGWGKLYFKIIMPNKKYTEPLVIYCWNSSKNITYFDNLTIKRKNYWKFFNQ